MTQQEVKGAMLTHAPVVFGDITYAFIYEYVLRFGPGGEPLYTLGLMDRNLNCIVRANLEKVRLATPEEAEELRQKMEAMRR